MKLINKELCRTVSSHLHTMDDSIKFWTSGLQASVSTTSIGLSQLGLLYPSSSKNCKDYQTTSCFFDVTLRYRH